jgi:hypothetical protein
MAELRNPGLISLTATLMAGLIAGAAFTGCGTPAAPQPPSLNLPVLVSNLSATRAGDAVTLTFTLPRKTTDKLLLKGNIDVHLCRQEATGAPCKPAGAIALTPGVEGTLEDTLPAELAAGAPRPLTYFVELRNRNGRSAGLSNPAVILAGQAPAPLSGFTVELRKQGALLHWTGDTPTLIRLHRKSLTPPAEKAATEKTEGQGILAPSPEPVDLSLLVEPQAAGSPAQRNRALDKSIRTGETYEYTAQQVARVTLNGQSLELPGPLTAPVRLEAKDIFPPETPTGLAAVATSASAGLEAAIDLSWQPVTDANLAGYIVYRREGAAAWQRISPAQPTVSPAFHDTQAQPGHTYRYAVSAIGQNGQESARSAEAEESMPAP